MLYIPIILKFVIACNCRPFALKFVGPPNRLWPSIPSMKVNYLALSILYLAFGIFSCNGPGANTLRTDSAMAVTSPDTNSSMLFLVDSLHSLIHWEGQKVIGPPQFGTLPIHDGKIVIENGGIVGGHFAVNMKNIKVTDNSLSQTDRASLEKHLKSDDFFMVNKYPIARFEVTGINPYLESISIENKPVQTLTFTTEKPNFNISGNLIIKDSSLNINFPARVLLEPDSVVCLAKFVINRKDWGINYQSDASLGNNMIQPSIKLDIRLVARKNKVISPTEIQ
jgi:polyisoprenoid-binding protein YceI